MACKGTDTKKSVIGHPSVRILCIVCCLCHDCIRGCWLSGALVLSLLSPSSMPSRLIDRHVSRLHQVPGPSLGKESGGVETLGTSLPVFSLGQQVWPTSPFSCRRNTQCSHQICSLKLPCCTQNDAPSLS